MGTIKTVNKQTNHHKAPNQTVNQCCLPFRLTPSFAMLSNKLFSFPLLHLQCFYYEVRINVLQLKSFQTSAGWLQWMEGPLASAGHSSGLSVSVRERE